MASEWQAHGIKSLGRVVTGKTPPTSNKDNFDGPYPFVTIPDLGTSVFVNETERTLSKAGAGLIRPQLLPPGSVMISCIATVGKCGITTKPSFTNQQINSLVCNEGVDARYIYYCFKRLGPELQAAGGCGSVYTNISMSRFENIEVYLPPLPEQRAIAHILGTLDDKIELNRRMNATLEAITRTLFQSWFVNFDPVRAKSEGREPEGMDSETAALFPDTFEDSELGPIPTGWKVEPLDGIADFLNGLALQKYPPTGSDDLPVIKIAQLRQGNTQGAALANNDVPAQYVIEDGDVLFSWSGTLDVCLWHGGPGALNQHLFKVTSPTFPRWFYLHWVKHHLPDFQTIAASKATTMGHIQRHHLTGVFAVVPPAPVLQAAGRRMEPLLDLYVANGVQCRTLAETRNALLPKLLSGQVRVPEAMKTVGD